VNEAGHDVRGKTCDGSAGIDANISVEAGGAGAGDGAGTKDGVGGGGTERDGLEGGENARKSREGKHADNSLENKG